MTINPSRIALFVLIALFLRFGSLAFGGSATDVTGLYFTGQNSSGALAPGGARDANWTVTYARVGGTGSTSSAYTGAAYVLSNSYIDPAYVPNTSTAKWITAPGASTAASGGTLNVGGDYLPGIGTSGTNSAAYVYRLAFTIVGTGTGTATNNIQITMTIAADDRYTVYVNPASGPTVRNDGTINAGGTAASASGLNAWGNTTSFTLGNSTAGGGTNNATYVIGTNYIYVVVANTDSRTGTVSTPSLNPSGLLVYQVGSGITIDGRVVPEVGTWVPVAAALGFFGWRRFRRKGDPAASVG